MSVVEMAEYEWDFTQNVKRWQMRFRLDVRTPSWPLMLSSQFSSCGNNSTALSCFFGHAQKVSHRFSGLPKANYFLVMFKEKNKITESCVYIIFPAPPPKIQSSWTPTQAQNGDMLICGISPAALSYSTSENGLPPLYVLRPWPVWRLSLVQMPILWI